MANIKSFYIKETGNNNISYLSMSKDWANLETFKGKEIVCDLVWLILWILYSVGDVLNLCVQQKSPSHKVSHCFDMCLPRWWCGWQEGTNTTAHSHVAHKLHNNTCFCNTVHFELTDDGLSSALRLRAQWSYKVVPTLADRHSKREL